ncbi:MAG: GAF domain-containing protein [Chloroflexi bacterium]|nr:GAF domain-containing protein [Chloroflexota bacterium]
MNSSSTTNSANPVNSPENLHFGFWGNLPLSRKILLAFGVLFILTVVIAIVTLWGMNRTTIAYEEALTKGNEIRRISDLLAIDLLQARRAEKNFLLRWKEEGFDTAYANYITTETEDAASTRGPAYIQNITAIREDLKLLAPFGPVAETVSTGDMTRTQYEADIASLSQNVDTYDKNFTALVDTLRKKGYDENTGFEGEFRTAVRDIEAKISGQAGLEQLEITLLQIRRNEKDYLARGGQQYVDNVHTFMAQLKTQIAATDLLEPAVKTELRTQADTYLVAFDALVELDKEIAIHNEELIAAARAVEPLAAKLQSLGEQLAVDSTNEARANNTRTFTISIIVILVVMAISFVLAIALSRQITRPVTSLTNTAEQIASGNFEVQAEMTSADEIGTLAQAFNSMTSRLQQAFKEVADRSRDLATVAEISTRTTTIRDPYQMLATMVHLTQRGFNLYHAHVFTYHKDEDKLEIVACGYKEGDEHEGTHGTAVIPLQQEQSLVARAGRTRKSVIVNDVRSDPGWLPNPLLPDTHAELAVPMIVGDELVGVLDVQADHTDAFTMEDANIQMTLASEIATAYQNALSYERSKEEADLESLVNTIGQKIQRATTLEDTLQTAIRELGSALGASRVSANIQAARVDDITGEN